MDTNKFSNTIEGIYSSDICSLEKAEYVDSISLYAGEIDFLKLLKFPKLKKVTLKNCRLLNLNKLKDISIETLILDNCTADCKEVETSILQICATNVEINRCNFKSITEIVGGTKEEIINLKIINSIFNIESSFIVNIPSLKEFTYLEGRDGKGINLERSLNSFKSLSLLLLETIRHYNLSEIFRGSKIKETIKTMYLNVGDTDIEIQEFPVLETLELYIAINFKYSLKYLNSLSILVLQGNKGRLNIKEGHWRLKIVKEFNSHIEIYSHTPAILIDSEYLVEYPSLGKEEIDYAYIQNYNSFSLKD